MGKREDRDAINELTRSADALAKEHAAKRREIIRELLAKGHMPRYGFNKRVGQVCDALGIPHTPFNISRDVKKVMAEIEADTTVVFGKQRLLEALQAELEAVEMIPVKVKKRVPGKDGQFQEVSQFSGLLAIQKSKQKLAVLAAIAKIEGHEAPKKHQHTGLFAMFHQLPADVREQIALARPEEVRGILVASVGEQMADQIMQSAVAAELD